MNFPAVHGTSGFASSHAAAGRDGATQHGEQAMDTETIELKIETLSGDIRDALLTHVRAMEDPWSKLPEARQQDKIDAIAKMADDLVRRAVGMVAASGFDTLHIIIKDFAVKGGAVKGKFETSAISGNLIALADHENTRAVIVLADPGEYMGETAPARPDPEEPELPIGEPDGPGDGYGDDLGDIPAPLDRRKGNAQPEATA